MSAELDALLRPPVTVTRCSSREPVSFALSEDHRFVPAASYPCRGGLGLLARHYRPNLALLTRHREYAPGEENQGHTVLPAGIVRRESCIGTLYERHRALEKVFRQVMEENGSLAQEVARLRALLDGGAQQEEITQITVEHEREMRRAAERERSAAQRRLEEAEEALASARREASQLQALLQQAVESHHRQETRQYVGRVGV